MRYGINVIESGGEISGEVHALRQEEQAEARGTPETPDETPEKSTVSPEKA